jgi:ferredoxin-NADP reductase
MVHGRFTSKLDNAKVGDVYYVTGPYGQFKLDSNDKKLLFLAGGTGIAPFLSMLKQIEEKGLEMDIVLMYSVRYAADIICRKDLEGWEASLNARCCVTVTRPEQSPEWTGEKGHIDSNMIRKYASDVTDRTCYIVGPLAFTKAMKDTLKALGVDDSRIKADIWG